MIRYSTDHLWVRCDEGGRTAVAGITQHALDSLGEVMLVEIHAQGLQAQGAVVGAVESAKTASDLVMPLQAQLVQVNPALAGGVDAVNADPLGTGWLFRLADVQADQFSQLLDEAAYLQFIGAN